jgi:hypothetical protein
VASPLVFEGGDDGQVEAKKIPGHTHEKERAAELGFAIDTLRKWRRQGKGQAYAIVGREIFYIDADEPRWLASLKVTPLRSRRAA